MAHGFEEVPPFDEPALDEPPLDVPPLRVPSSSLESAVFALQPPASHERLTPNIKRMLRRLIGIRKRSFVAQPRRKLNRFSCREPGSPAAIVARILDYCACPSFRSARHRRVSPTSSDETGWSAAGCSSKTPVSF
jgi:hypothetical protein